MERIWITSSRHTKICSRPTSASSAIPAIWRWHSGDYLRPASIVAAEVRLKDPSKDLHSGIYGGSIANPVNALCENVRQACG